MEYVRLGRSDLSVSAIGLGTWQIGEPGWGWGVEYGEADVLAALERAFELGLNFVDTAEVYGDGASEEVVGKAVRGRRDEVVIATKVAGQHLRYRDVLKAAELSLRRLGTDRIDLYQVHWPNYYVPISETMKAMDKLIKDGKVRYVGLSNFPVGLMKEAQEQLREGQIISNQVRYNVLQRDVEKEILPYCAKEGIAVIAYSPLAQGLLTGKYNMANLPTDPIRRQNPLFRNRDNVLAVQGLIDTLRGIAAERGKTVAQVALNWLLRDTGATVVPIVGVKRREHGEEVVGALGWRLSPAEIEMIEEACSKIELTYF